MKSVTAISFMLSALLIMFDVSEADDNKMNQFTLSFYEKAVKSKPNDNFISSPMSVEILLGLLAFGARDETQKELFDTLKMNDLNAIKSAFKTKLTELNRNEGGVLKIANKIYVKKGESFVLHPDFKKTATDVFSSDMENVDFAQSQQTADIINRWVEDNTNNKIKNFVQADALDPRTIISLINAIYFQGNWEIQFSERLTSDRPFKKNGKSEVIRKMMYIEDDYPYANITELDAQVLGLPYKMKNTKMIIILPNKVDGLQELERKVKTLNIKNIMKRMYTREVQVTIPKFKIETTTDLIDILQELGVHKMFDSNQSNLSGLLKNPGFGLYVNYARQKAFVEVNEYGTEAAAVTEIRAVPMMAVLDETYFFADHPFMFLLVNNDDIIFCGRYVGA